MTIEEIEERWGKWCQYPISNPLHDFPKAQFAHTYISKLIEVAKAAKAWQHSQAFSGICDEEVLIELALRDLEKA